MAKRQRRLRGEGSIRERQGKFEIRYPLPVTPDGKRHRLYRYAADKATALKVLAELRELAKHPQPKSADLTVAAFLLEKWLPSLDLRPSTRKSYRTCVVQHVVPAIGTVSLAGLRPEHFAQLKAATLRTLRPSTATLVRQVFIASLHWAEDAGLITNVRALVHNRVSRPPTVSKRNYTWLTTDTRNLFLEEADASSPYATIYRVMLFLGLRVGEVLGLRWPDINLEQRQLTISHNLLHENGALVLAEPKTDGSKATLPWADSTGLTTALTDLKARQAFEKTMAPLWLDSFGLVFTDANGAAIPRSHLRDDFKKVLRQAGLPDMRVHDMRHSCISLLMASGAPVKVVQMFARHQKSATTMDTYSHMAPQELEKAAAALAAGLR